MTNNRSAVATDCRALGLGLGLGLGSSPEGHVQRPELYYSHTRGGRGCCCSTCRPRQQSNRRQAHNLRDRFGNPECDGYARLIGGENLQDSTREPGPADHARVAEDRLWGSPFLSRDCISRQCLAYRDYPHGLERSLQHWCGEAAGASGIGHRVSRQAAVESARSCPTWLSDIAMFVHEAGQAPARRTADRKKSCMAAPSCTLS